ncbi:MAG: methyltransferase domain-containing protein [Desulfobulbaceae bacterium]|nr:methyltransferase domain-containing protein [Desulfobulbaceae bacterium]
MDNYYEDNHQHYFDSTVCIDPSAFLEPLAKLLQPQATILDIGCGSGRDLLWLARRGFRPTGFEQSPSLAKLARKHSNCPVLEGDFNHFDFSKLHFNALIFPAVTDFNEFLEKRDYTFSYKIIFLLSFFKICNERYEAPLPALLELYQRFYQNVLAKHGRNERENCPYNRQEFLDDSKVLQINLLANPFEKFERKRFFYQCKDLNYLALDPVLINTLTTDHHKKIIDQMVQDLQDYYRKLEIPLSETDYFFLLPELKENQLETLFIDTPTEEQKYSTALPFYPLSIAAGEFMNSEISGEPESWFVVEGLTTKQALSPSMFVAQVTGKSMEPAIPDGSYCLFTFETGGTRNDQIVLAQKSDIADQDTGASYTVKRYQSTKRADPETGWRHESIILKPANPAYQEIVIPPSEADDFKIVAFLIEVLPVDTF